MSDAYLMGQILGVFLMTAFGVWLVEKVWRHFKK